MSDSVLAWHFSDGELRFDYAGVKVEAGLVLETREKPVVEKSGFHASQSPLDALRWYAVRPQEKFIISRVHLSGQIIADKQRIIGQKREHLWVADAKAVLESFAEMQRLKIEKISQSKTDLEFSVYKWLDPNRHYKANSTQLFEKELAAIPLHPLGNQVLEFAGHAFRLENKTYQLRIWEKAKEAGFDLDAYLKQNLIKYMLHDWVGDSTEEKTLKHIEQINREHAFWWAIKHPPQEFFKYVSAPKDSSAVFHEMLMQLAPEGYAE